MIPDFKTYIKESVWGDLRKKSLGQEERKEDEIGDEEYDFLNDCVFEFAARVVWDHEKNSFEKFTNCIRTQVKQYKNIDVERVIAYTKNHWEDVSKNINDSIASEEKEKEDGMNESVWADIRKKSLGTEERKEDNIEMLFSILDNTYTCLSRQAPIEIIEDTIKVPLFFDNVRHNRRLSIIYDKDNKKSIRIDAWVTKILEKSGPVLTDKYDVKMVFDNSYCNIFDFICPKDGKDVNDDFCIDVIDTIIDNIPEIYSKLLERK